jgi:PASTA domain
MLCAVDRIPTRRSRVGAALALTLITLLTSLLVAPPATAAPDVPNVVGMSATQAELALQTWNPKIVIAIEPYDLTNQAIVPQDGFTLPAGLNLDLFTVAAQQAPFRAQAFVAAPGNPVIDLGLTVSVPDLTNLTGDAAQTLLNSEALALVAADRTFTTDVITGQVPAAGTLVGVQGVPSARVVVQMAAPPTVPAPIIVPDVVGMSVGGAQAVLQAVGLTGAVTPAGAPDTDTVARQSPVAGASVQPGSAIALGARTPTILSSSSPFLTADPTTIGIGVGLLIILLALVYLLVRAVRRSRRRPRRSPEIPRERPAEPARSPHPAGHAPVVAVSFRPAEPPRQEARSSGPTIRIGLDFRPEQPTHDVSEVKA